MSLKIMLFLGILKAAVIIPRKRDTANLIKELGSMWRTDNLNEYQTKKKNIFLKRLNLGHAGEINIFISNSKFRLMLNYLFQ